MKQRLFDITVATIVLIMSAPIMLAVAIGVARSSPGPVLYRAPRVGRKGSTFVAFKFRSMRIGVDGPGITVGGDDRITRIGRVLRQTKLDELPQMWNVLRGEMSIVGPRPEDPRNLDWYTPDQLELFDWRPGITSPASVTFRDEERRLAGLLEAGCSLEDAYRTVLADKVAIDRDYFSSRTITSDIVWVARTVGTMFHRD